ncbi:MAG: hypothetical protein ACP5HD_07705 [Thermoproteus sp.]
MRQTLSAVDERPLEEWTAEVLQAERPASRPDVLARAGPMTPARTDGG